MMINRGTEVIYRGSLALENVSTAVFFYNIATRDHFRSTSFSLAYE
jgi:hypothetical protein